MFRALKWYIKSHFPKSKPEIKLLIPFIIPCMDQKYLEREFRASNKRMVIRHENERYNEAFGEASEHLNELGMRIFHETVLELEKRRELLSIVKKQNDENVDEVVVENYQRRLTSGVVVEYQTTEVSCNCNCSRFKQKGLCLHVNFFREEKQLPAFEKKMFLGRRYLRDLSVYEGAEIPPTSPVSVNPSSLGQPESPGTLYYQKSKEKVLTKNAKWRAAHEINKVISEKVSHYEPTRFRKYLSFLKSVEHVVTNDELENHGLLNVFQYQTLLEQCVQYKTLHQNTVQSEYLHQQQHQTGYHHQQYHPQVHHQSEIVTF